MSTEPTSDPTQDDTGPAGAPRPAWMGGVLLGLAAAALNAGALWAGVPSAPGTAAVLVALGWSGPGPGALAAALSLLSLALAGGGPALVLLHAIELVVVALLALRLRSVILGASGFWLALAATLVLGSMSPAVFARSALVGLVAAVLAEAALLRLCPDRLRGEARLAPLWASALPHAMLTVTTPLLGLMVVPWLLGDSLVPSLLIAMVAAGTSAVALMVAADRFAVSLRGITATLGQRQAGALAPPMAAAPPGRELREFATAVNALQEAVVLRDATTGLPNRKLLEERLELAMGAGPWGSETFALLHVDLDRYRLVDSSLGRDAAEGLLTMVARRLESLVGPKDTVARVGDDEFAVMLPGVEDQAAAENFALKLMEAIKRPFTARGGDVFLTATVGIGLFPRDGATPSTLLRNATAATHAAKQKGHDSYRRYTARVSAREVRRMFLETGLRKALENNTLALHYQPIVEIGTGRARRVEALLRWASPDGTFIPPAEFIPIAESTGLVLAVDAWVLNAACAALRSFAESGPDIAVSINLSARQFQQRDLPRQVADALARHGVKADRLGIEITEGSALQDFERSAESLRALRALGLRVSIDDFGTGHSSLSYLSRLPVDTVKLDGSFVRDLEIRPENAAIASAVIAMSHSLGLDVVAECVETEAQLAFLSQQRCNAVQGFLASPALTVHALRERLANPAPLLPGVTVAAGA